MGQKELQIVLVEPEGPLNVGSIARAMKNFGFHQLILVNPKCDPGSDDALKMAVHAKDVLKNARVLSSLQEALEGCPRAVATTARERIGKITLQTPEKALPWLLEIEQPGALIFGPEDRGLSNKELQMAQTWMKIPTDPAYPTLNLAQSVALCCFEMFRLFPAIHASHSETNEATLDAVESYLEHLSSLLLEIGYLYPHTQSSRMAKFRQLLHRMHPSPEELALLRGVVRQVEWALQKTGDSELKK
ncbi:MAG: RNA methyltransferase [SAR324 cluster bacterium]|nr:RNA methyltransferase [SAR324 cluster bacterium]